MLEVSKWLRVKKGSSLLLYMNTFHRHGNNSIIDLLAAIAEKFRKGEEVGEVELRLLRSVNTLSPNPNTKSYPK